MTTLRLAPVLGIGLALAAHAGGPLPPVGLLNVGVFENGDEWFFDVNLEGSNAVASATLTPPGKPAFALTCVVLGPSATGCEYDDPPDGLPGFDSLASLVSVYPAGQWLLTVNGTLTASITFAPVEPNSEVQVTSPANGSVAGGTPTISYTHGCSNCGFLYFELDGDAQGVELEAMVGGTPPPSPGSISYDEWVSLAGPKPALLPDGEYTLLSATATGGLAIVTLSDASTFQYAAATSLETVTSFTVPEPAESALAVLAVLFGLARRRGRAAPS